MSVGIRMEKQKQTAKCVFMILQGGEREAQAGAAPACAKIDYCSFLGFVPEGQSLVVQMLNPGTQVLPKAANLLSL